MIVEFTIESPMRMGLVKCLQRVDTVHKTAPWMKNITLKNVFVEGGMPPPSGKGARRFEPIRNVRNKWVVAFGKIPQHYNYIKYLFRAPGASVAGDIGKRN